MSYEEKLRKAWEDYGEEAGQFIDKYDKRFRSIIEKYRRRHDFDELYSNYVLYLIPIYIENWDSIKQPNLLDWICYCIKLRVIKHTGSNSNGHFEQFEQSSLNNNLVCHSDQNNSIKEVEDTLSGYLTGYEVYLVKSLVMEQVTLTEVSKLVCSDRRTVKSDLDIALGKLRQVYE